jgi:hypothetical protein
VLCWLLLARVVEFDVWWPALNFLPDKNWEPDLFFTDIMAELGSFLELSFEDY